MGHGRENLFFWIHGIEVHKSYDIQKIHKVSLRRWRGEVGLLGASVQLFLSSFRFFDSRFFDLVGLPVRKTEIF